MATLNVEKVISTDKPVFTPLVTVPAINAGNVIRNSTLSYQLPLPTNTYDNIIIVGSPAYITVNRAGKLVINGNHASIVGAVDGTSYNFTVRYVRGSVSTDVAYSFKLVDPAGDLSFTTPGTFTFVVPTGVTSVSALCVGAGGSGSYSWANSSGSGGGLAYANNIAVTPGQSITVTVPPRVTGNTNGAAASFGSFFSASGGYYSGTSDSAVGKPVAGTVTPFGGMGGYSPTSYGYGGGGGAGGYGTTTTGADARGGMGGYGGSQLATAGTNGAGGGGTGYQSSTYGFGGGGGVGLFGRGSSGAAATYPGNDFYSSANTGGKAGSGGEPGAGNNNSTETITSALGSRTMYHGEGGRYGGGGGGGGTSISGNGNFCAGAQGAVRVFWGGGRSFPTNAAFYSV